MSRSRMQKLVLARNTAQTMFLRACAEKESWLAPLYHQRLLACNARLLRQFPKEG